MMYFSEKFEFAAMHRLWNDEFSDKRNFALFGKCANPTGHGHNYVIEVTVKTPPQGNDFCIGDFGKIVDDEFIKQVDHKNLNIDVPQLSSVNPTVENIASFACKNGLIEKRTCLFNLCTNGFDKLTINHPTCCLYASGS